MSRRDRLAKGKLKVEQRGLDTDRDLLTFPASKMSTTLSQCTGQKITS